MSNSIEVNVSDVLNSLSEAGQSAIGHYAEWFFASAISWIAFGVVLVIGAYANLRYGDLLIDDYEKPVKVFLSVFFAFIGCLFIFASIPDLASPSGAAINQLIHDIRG